jgi:hypothetical protein
LGTVITDPPGKRLEEKLVVSRCLPAWQVLGLVSDGGLGAAIRKELDAE